MRMRASLMGLLLAIFVLMTPLGLFILRLGGLTSFLWVFGTWLLLVLMAAVSSGQKK